jgi:hypothetical protein
MYSRPQRICTSASVKYPGGAWEFKQSNNWY